MHNHVMYDIYVKKEEKNNYYTEIFEIAVLGISV